MTGWDDLDRELDRWGAEGRTATFWWRDDDAAAPTDALARLLELRAAARLPLSLAVIPAAAVAALSECIRGTGSVCVLQHGFDHADRNRGAGRRMELAAGRDRREVARQLADGRGRLESLFGGAALPILVPPWNRIDPAIVALLPALGYAGLSGLAPRPSREAAPALIQVNVHADIIDWRGGRGFRGTDAVLGDAVAHLARRRAALVDADEPTGLLTHHAVHDAACWEFVAAFTARTGSHPAARWVSARDAFAIRP